MRRPIHNRFIVPTRRNTTDKNAVSVIILGGAMGYRMKSYGPKSLMKLPTGESLLQRQIDEINVQFPNNEIILTVGFDADKVIRKVPVGIRIVENQMYESTNMVEEARLAVNNSVNESVLLICGDILFNVATLKGIVKKESSVIIDKEHHMDDSSVGVTVVNNEATIFSYGLDTKWCDIAYLTGKELKSFRSLVNNRDFNKMFMFEIFNMILDKGGSMKAIQPFSMQVTKIDSPKVLRSL